MPDVSYTVRAATPSDAPAIAELIGLSARHLGLADYSAEQIEAALRGAFGVDTQLVKDGSYFVADLNGRPIGCGGWSFRRTLFGGDSHTRRDASLLDPANDAAKIRAFFVHPSYSRIGVATAILKRCESAAQSRGFSRFELMATLPGQKFYRAHGYSAGTPVDHDLGDGLQIRFVPMHKSISGG